MKYVVFEAGSRAGFSAEMFYRAWKKNHSENNTSIIMGDIDSRANDVPVAECVSRKWDSVAQAYLDKSNYRVFPGDELTRQRNEYVRNKCYGDVSTWVLSEFYNKVVVNTLLERICEGSYIKIPKTFNLDSVFIKPNTGSAGSRGLSSESNVCVSEKIDIKTEYVIDVLEIDGQFKYFAREVVLRSGYDKLVKLLPNTHKVVCATRQLVEMFNDEYEDFPLFRGVFHVQIAEDYRGDYFFIEASKRISGTSIVNVFRGYNPFDVLEGTPPVEYWSPFEEGKWYRYEDFILELSKLV